MLGGGAGENNSRIIYSRWFRGTSHNFSMYWKNTAASSIIQASDSKYVPVHLSLDPYCLGSYFDTIADSSSLLNGVLKVWTIFIGYLYKNQTGLNGVILPPTLL